MLFLYEYNQPHNYIINKYIHFKIVTSLIWVNLGKRQGSSISLMSIVYLLLKRVFKIGESVISIQITFQGHFIICQNNAVLDRKLILLWVENFKSTSSFIKREALGKPWSAWTPVYLFVNLYRHGWSELRSLRIVFKKNGKTLAKWSYNCHLPMFTCTTKISNRIPVPNGVSGREFSYLHPPLVSNISWF